MQPAQTDPRSRSSQHGGPPSRALLQLGFTAANAICTHSPHGALWHACTSQLYWRGSVRISARRLSVTAVRMPPNRHGGFLITTGIHSHMAIAQHLTRFLHIGYAIVTTVPMLLCHRRLNSLARVANQGPPFHALSSRRTLRFVDGALAQTERAAL